MHTHMHIHIYAYIHTHTHTHTHQHADKAAIMEMFAEIDADGSGALDEEELRNFGKTLGFEWDNTFAQVCVIYIDTIICGIAERRSDFIGTIPLENMQNCGTTLGFD